MSRKNLTLSSCQRSAGYHLPLGVGLSTVPLTALSQPSFDWPMASLHWWMCVRVCMHVCVSRSCWRLNKSDNYWPDNKSPWSLKYPLTPPSQTSPTDTEEPSLLATLYITVEAHETMLDPFSTFPYMHTHWQSPLPQLLPMWNTWSTENIWCFEKVFEGHCVCPLYTPVNTHTHTHTQHLSLLSLVQDNSCWLRICNCSNFCFSSWRKSDYLTGCLSLIIIIISLCGWL